MILIPAAGGALPLSAQDDVEVQELRHGRGRDQLLERPAADPTAQSMTELVTGFVDENPDVKDQLPDFGLGHILRQAFSRDCRRQRWT